MIRFIKKGDKITPAELVGRYTMRAGGKLWNSANAPVFVSAMDGKSAVTGNYVHLRYQSVEGEGCYLPESSLSANDERIVATRARMRCQDVFVVCDTIEEVTALRNLDLDVGRQFDALIAAAKRSLGALDGRSIGAVKADEKRG